MVQLLQAKALTVSSAVCCLFGVAGYYAITLSGVQTKETAEVASLHDAITLAEDQRVSSENSSKRMAGVSQAWKSVSFCTCSFACKQDGFRALQRDA